MENLFKNQGPLWWVIISLILMTVMFESKVILLGEIRSQSLLEIKGLKILNEINVNFCQVLPTFLYCNSVAVQIVVLRAIKY